MESQNNNDWQGKAKVLRVKSEFDLVPYFPSQITKTSLGHELDI
jgi:hypothetical protein